jgi:hypothetical protein
MSTIKEQFELRKDSPSDINEHLEALYEYAKRCETVVEFGVRCVVSTYALAHARPKKLLALDLYQDPGVEIFLSLCKNEYIDAEFVLANTLDYELPYNYDLLLIDTMHTYTQLSRELERHHSKINKYIIFHDTVTYGWENEPNIYGYVEETGNSSKRGLVPAIQEFLLTQTHWKVDKVFTNNNGLTVIKNSLNC